MGLSLQTSWLDTQTVENDGELIYVVAGNGSSIPVGLRSLG